MLLFLLSTGGKFQTVSNFMELHALTQATCSYVLLLVIKGHNTTSKDNWGSDIFAGSYPSNKLLIA